jgi:hypothetical protein
LHQIHGPNAFNCLKKITLALLKKQLNMTDANQFHDQLFDDFKPIKKMPDMINVCSILTFIWSGLCLILAVVSYSMVCTQAEALDENASKLEVHNAFLTSMMKSSSDVVHRSCEMRLPLLIMTLVFLVACIIGAILMRQLKKTGYFIYLIGELGLPIGTIALVGTTVVSGVLGFLFPVVFLILYGTQLGKMK